MKYLYCLFLGIFCCAAPLKADDTQQKLIHEVETYFAQLKTYEADFVQLNPDRSAAKGKFYLSRPNKFRLQYEAPKKTVLISDGTFFIEYDPKENMPNFLSLDSTPAAILMRDQIKLSGDITVQNIQNFRDLIQVTLSRTDDPNLGQITLTFKGKPLTLVHWVIHDAQGNTTEVGLKNIQQNIKLSSSLFRGP